jgi:hypothetical protein
MARSYLADLLCSRAAELLKKAERVAEACASGSAEGAKCLAAKAALGTRKTVYYSYGEWLEDLETPDHPLLRKIWDEGLGVGGLLILTALRYLDSAPPRPALGGADKKLYPER